MKKMMLFLLGVRMLFLAAATAMCLFGLFARGEVDPGIGWRIGYFAGLMVCGFLIGQVWKSLKATWRE